MPIKRFTTYEHVEHNFVLYGETQKCAIAHSRFRCRSYIEIAMYNPEALS